MGKVREPILLPLFQTTAVHTFSFLHTVIFQGVSIFHISHTYLNTQDSIERYSNVQTQTHKLLKSRLPPAASVSGIKRNINKNEYY